MDCYSCAQYKSKPCARKIKNIKYKDLAQTTGIRQGLSDETVRNHDRQVCRSPDIAKQVIDFNNVRVSVLVAAVLSVNTGKCQGYRQRKSTLVQRPLPAIDIPCRPQGCLYGGGISIAGNGRLSAMEKA
ncbi:MAG TPA: hypothetical protein ENK40_04120 [Gammaproteobacteria bacterium]|nr:hypothetical protein [Gammaproteobacteria bacterium]